jgi:hypothetical protein
VYYAGSAGSVDPGDIGKVICTGSVLQLGRGATREPPPVAGGGAPPPAAGSEADAEIPIPSVTATIRYPVVPDIDTQPISNLWLGLRYLPGDGHIAATLIRVSTLLPDIGTDPGTVTETSLLEFDSSQFQSSLTFISNAAAGLDTANANDVMDFGGNAYYIALSLTAPAIAIAQPPAVAVIGVALSPIGTLP